MDCLRADWLGRPDCSVAADISNAPATAVVVLTVAEAERLLQRTPAVPMLVIWRTHEEPLLAALCAHPQVASRAGCAKRRRCHRALRSAQVLAQAAQQLRHVLDVGRALASEKDLDTLLALILEHARAHPCRRRLDLRPRARRQAVFSSAAELFRAQYRRH